MKTVGIQKSFEREKMKEKIWRVLFQILYNSTDTADIVKPFFKNLKNDDINSEKHILLLKTFSDNQLEVLYKNGIITEEKLYSFISKK